MRDPQTAAWRFRKRQMRARPRADCCLDPATSNVQVEVQRRARPRRVPSVLRPWVRSRASTTLREVRRYLDFIVARAAGELMTPAAWMRSFIRSHADYKHDSLVSPRIATDLMVACHKIGQGQLHVPELHGDLRIEPLTAKDALDARLLSELPVESVATQMGRAVERYAARGELLAKKRKLQADVQAQRRALEASEASLSKVDSELARYL